MLGNQTLCYRNDVDGKLHYLADPFWYFLLMPITSVHEKDISLYSSRKIIHFVLRTALTPGLFIFNVQRSTQ